MAKLNYIVFILSAWIYLSCKTQTPQASTSTVIKEGLSGIVLWREGNFMPSIDGNNKNKSVGVSREILIYELTKVDQAKKEGDFFKEIATKLIKSITSDQKGNFQVELAPGTYSIFTKEEGELYANIYDGENNIFPVTVDPGKISNISIIIDYKAAY